MEEQKFSTVIEPKNGWFDLHLKELLQYRDLVFLFCKEKLYSKL